MNAAVLRLRTLNSKYPEWNPWLVIVERVIAESVTRNWEEYVPARPEPTAAAPLLAHTSIVLPRDLPARWLEELLQTAATSGAPAYLDLAHTADTGVEAVELFRAALAEDAGKLEEHGRNYGDNSQAFQSIARMLPVPFLQACKRLWSISEEVGWSHGYCPLCGAWPALAEVRGIERTRYLRCARCGDQWPAHVLRCVFCGTDDHEQLPSLVPETGAQGRSIEACRRCSGYLKSLPALQGADPLGVLLDDLANVDLDIAAVEQGFHRPAGPGYALQPTVGYSKSGGKRIFSWRRAR